MTRRVKLTKHVRPMSTLVKRRTRLTSERMHAEVAAEEARPPLTRAQIAEFNKPATFNVMERMTRALISLVTDLGFELTLRNLAILVLVYNDDAPVQTVPDIGAVLKLHRSVMSRTADKLHELQLVKKDKDPRKETRVYLFRTKRGQKLYDKLKGTMDV